MTDKHLTDADAIAKLAELGAAAAGSLQWPEITIDSYGLPKRIPLIARHGIKPELISIKNLIEEYRTAPERRKGVATATTLASFIDLTNRHKDASSVLFARTLWPDPSLTSVIDYHQLDGGPRFREHRVAYKFPLTREFEAWIKFNGQSFNQAAFATFIEDRIAELSVAMDVEKQQFEPLFRAKFALPTELIELARGLSIHVGSKVKNAFRTQSGEAEILFETEHTNAKGEPLHIPGLFMLSLPVFLDGAEVRIAARLSYRVQDAAVLWTYRLYRWEEILRRRVVEDFLLAAKQTELPYFEGAPE